MQENNVWSIAAKRNHRDAQKYRLAQARRLLRECRAAGVEVEDVSGELLDRISDDDGRIVPEPQDLLVSE